jgi:putative flippase GtrA
MLAVSLTGFAINEALYAVLLKSGLLDYRAALVIVLITVAAGTYIGTRFWVFKSTDARS